MTKEHLLKIANNTWRKYTHMDEENEEFKKMFEPNYETIPFGEQHIKTCLLFEYKNHGLTYKSGSLSCTGLVLNFNHERFENVSVTILYDYYRKEIYNSVLAYPKYTKSDWDGKKTIRQSATKILSDRDLSSYFKRLYKRFECPTMALQGV